MSDDWVKAAMADDSMVAELLMRLHTSEVSASPPVKRLTAALPFGWGVTQPRSRQMIRCKKEGELTRASPTTPLSWSAGTSLSGAVAGGDGGGACDGYEESSRLVPRPSGGRSKFQGTASNGTTIRRPRKKKTFPELKEDEDFLLKERISLKKELAAMRLSCEEERARNKTLKRMKLDLQLHSGRRIGTGYNALADAVTDQSQHSEAANVDHTPTYLPMKVTCDEPKAILCPSLAATCKVEKDDAGRENPFVLPDLNMPVDEDSGSETLYGMS